MAYCLSKKLLKERKDKQREDNKNTVNMLSLNNLAAYGCEMVIEQEKDEELLTLEEELTVYITLEKNSRISQVRGALRLHSKGLGVVCAKPEGISKNDLVVKYIGEVYPPWYWCIKQDVIKSFLLMVKKGRLKNLAQYKNNFNIDFYNIMLEKHPKEPKGRDIVIVDPIIRGNFASRLSHSCDPNCVALPVISNGQYSIAMYALRQIEHGEELTFDYCSFTESETEFKNSVCLCGTLLCKGHYLGYTKKHVHFFSGEAKKYLLDNTNSFFLRNNAAVLKACLSSFNKEKEEFLLKNGLGDNTFKDAPNWLKNWAYNVLKTILMERETLYRELLGFEFADIGQSSNMMSPQQIQIKFETDSLFFQRINNLIISIDKMGFFIRKQSQTQKKEKPLRLLKPKEYVSMIKRVMQQLKDHISSKLPVNIQKLIDCYLDQAKSFKSNQLFQKMKTLSEPISNIDVLKVIEGKHIMLLISDFLQKTEKPQLKAMGDIIYLMAFTVAYFFGHTYDSFSINIAVRECDLTSSKRALLHNSQSEEEQIAKLISPIITLPK